MPKLETWRVTPSLLESLCGLCLSRPWNVLNRFSSSCSSRSSAGDGDVSIAKLRRPDGRYWRYPWLPATVRTRGDSWHMAGTVNWQMWTVHSSTVLKRAQRRIVPGTVPAVTKIAWKKKFGITKPPEEAKAFPPSRSTPRKLSTKMDLAVEGWVKAWTTQKMVKGRVLVKKK